MQVEIAALERQLGLAREVIALLAAELPPERILDPRVRMALELALTQGEAPTGAVRYRLLTRAH